MSTSILDRSHDARVTAADEAYQTDHRADPVDEETLRRLSTLAFLLDDRFRIPGTNVRFGWDSIVGLVPGIGDLGTAAVSSYIVLEGRRLGAPKRLLMKMAGNIAIDAAVGLVPIVGDILDIQWKANRKNVNLLMDHARKGRPKKFTSA